jgi:hypothetical protein
VAAVPITSQTRIKKKKWSYELGKEEKQKCTWSIGSGGQDEEEHYTRIGYKETRGGKCD